MEFTPIEPAAAAGMVSTVLLIPLFFSFVIGIFMIITYWKIFEKAGFSGILTLIPFYNYYIVCKICGYGIGIFILSFLPFVNIIPTILIPVKLAEILGGELVSFLGFILFR